MSQKFVQAQPFSLAGSGAILGATSITLSSFARLDGTVLTMADFGSKGFITLEPGSADNEEAITFTGITANSNGTITLTGVKNQLTYYPYTETSGLAKTHVGATTAIISNTAGFYDEMTSNGNDETVTGKWIFTQSPDVPTPISASTTAAVNVDYVNGVVLLGAAKASTATFGVNRLSTAPVTASVPIAVGDNDTRVLTQAENDAAVGNSVSVAPSSSTNVFITQQGFQRNQERYASSGGTATALTLTLSPSPIALIAGEMFSFKSSVANGATPTLNVNGLGAKSLVKMSPTGTTVLVAGDIATNIIVLVEYNNAEFQVLTPTANAPTALPIYKNGITSHDLSTTTTTTIAHGLGVIPKYIRIASVVDGWSHGVYNGTTQSCIYSGTGNFGTSSTYTVRVDGASNGAIFSTAVATFDATNITLTWTRTGADTQVAPILWEAYA